jgi:hypothetical protein
MPKKLRREKILQSKRKQISQQSATPVPQQAAPVEKPPALPPHSSSPAVAASKRVLYPYIMAELSRIGILAGIILAILIILAVVL